MPLVVSTHIFSQAPLRFVSKEREIRSALLDGQRDAKGRGSLFSTRRQLFDSCTFNDDWVPSFGDLFIHLSICCRLFTGMLLASRKTAWIRVLRKHRKSQIRSPHHNLGTSRNELLTCNWYFLRLGVTITSLVIVFVRVEYNRPFA